MEIKRYKSIKKEAKRSGKYGDTWKGVSNWDKKE